MDMEHSPSKCLPSHPLMTVNGNARKNYALRRSGGERRND
jgi:hypothetical protein